MNVFLGWSGERSKAVAELLHYWMKCVNQRTDPWISSREIPKGTRCFSEINNALKDMKFGIICLTKENKNSPWILFESGLLSKGLSENRVCTLLVDLEAKDIADPLAQFNNTIPNRDGLWSLVQTINTGLETNRLELSILENTFEALWPMFETKFKDIIEKIPVKTVTPPRFEKKMLKKIIKSNRNFFQRVRRIEEQGNRRNFRQEGTAFNGSTTHADFTPPQTKELVFFEGIDIAKKKFKSGADVGTVYSILTTNYGFSKMAAKEIAETVFAKYAHRSSGA
jgi:hypothetical protein